MLLGPSENNRPSLFYESYNAERMRNLAPNGDMGVGVGGVVGPVVQPVQLPPAVAAHAIPVAAAAHYQETRGRADALLAQPIAPSVVPAPAPANIPTQYPVIPHNTTLQFANFAPQPRQTPIGLNGHIPLMLANNGPYHSRVQYYQATLSFPHFRHLICFFF